MVHANSRKNQDKELFLGAYPPYPGGWVWLVVLISRLGRRGAGLVGIPNEVPAAAEHQFGPPAVQCES